MIPKLLQVSKPVRMVEISRDSYGTLWKMNTNIRIRKDVRKKGDNFQGDKFSKKKEIFLFDYRLNYRKVVFIDKPVTKKRKKEKSGRTSKKKKKGSSRSIYHRLKAINLSRFIRFAVLIIPLVKCKGVPICFVMLDPRRGNLPLIGTL